ncbi:hypothetical protein ABZ929_22365 [Streptomyces physcomitrii]|uniref:hypothetical protein n=1 Tax=Streptomyces physcomitrii TaxID=2724184 RepID=UPI00341DE34E
MVAEQLPVHIREFVDYWGALLARLDPRAGWYGVFWQRDPQGMRACAEGREVPPWDVVEALLQDLAAHEGAEAAAGERPRARALHGACAAAYDARSGGREALLGRLELMLGEQRRATGRLQELAARLSTADSATRAREIAYELSWARDDQHRARARCAELRFRLGALEQRRSVGGGVAAAAGSAGGWSGEERSVPVPEPRSAEGDAASGPRPAEGGSAPGSRSAGVESVAEPRPRETAVVPEQATAGTRQRRRARGGARFAGAVAESEPALPELGAALPAVGGAAPRGARFAGVRDAERAVPDESGPRGGTGPEADTAVDREIAEMIAALLRLRTAGRTGEAHILLAEAAQWPASVFPRIAALFGRAGLAADWDTLLWEVSSLPTERLVAVADALTAGGRAQDAAHLLRQGAGRPPAEIGAAVLRLAESGRHREVHAVLDSFLRTRSAQEAADLAQLAPARLVPLLRGQAAEISPLCAGNLVHALRVAGVGG